METTKNQAVEPSVDGEVAPAAGPVGADHEALVMTMLHEHVPLSLLCDLTLDEGAESAEILAEEGQPDDPWWEQ